MKVTYITSDNAEYFEGLAPVELLYEKNLVCLGAIANDGTACAVLAVGIYGETAYIEWLYTDPAYRRKRAARSLLESLRALLNKIDMNILLVSFSVDCDYLDDFFTAVGFFVDADKNTYSVPLIDLVFSEKTDRLEDSRSRNGSVVNLDDLDDPNVFIDFLKEKNISLLENELASCAGSLILLDQKGTVTGFMLISRRAEGSLSIPFLVSNGSTGGFTDLILAFKNLVIEKGWLEENVIFSDRTGEMIEFVEDLLGEDIENYIVSGQKQGMKML